jgi:transposase
MMGLEITSGVERRRRWSTADKLRIVAEADEPGAKVADDLGGGFSTLNKWVSAHCDTDVISAEDRDLARENERLRRE